MNRAFFTLIEISEICQIEIDFLKELVRFGILELKLQNNIEYLNIENIDQLKMIKRLHDDLGINKEGIEVILSMRKRIVDLQNQVNKLQSQLERYSSEHRYRNLDIIIKKGLLIDL